MLEDEGAKKLSTLFNSTTAPIPGVRRDIQIIPVQDSGRDLLLFFDSMKFAKGGFALDRSVEPVLSLIDGRKTISDITSYFGNGTDQDQILQFIQMLDKQLLLESKHFLDQAGQVEQAFEKSDTRKPALAGSSYPDHPKELSDFADKLLNTAASRGSVTTSKALYAPHIDLQVGGDQYGQAFASLKTVKPRLVVILATSHYGGFYPDLYSTTPFMGTYKSFELPGRILHTRKDAVDQLAEAGESIGFTTRDRAHRVEHSIETHLLFASHIWKHNFQILPILVGSLDELFYKEDGELGRKLQGFTKHLRQLDSEDTFFLVSGDLSHVGKKFGDSDPARILRPDVEAFDLEFMNSAVENNPGRMLHHIARNYDPYRICGFPPLYTFLKAFPNLTGQRINYQWWDESQRESAVSFGSIAYQ